MLYLVEETFLPLFWLQSVPLQLVLLQSAGCRIFPAALTGRLVSISVNDWSTLTKVATNLYIIFSSHKNMRSG